MVDVTHDRDDRWPRYEIFGLVGFGDLSGVRGVLLLANGLEAELTSDQLDLVEVESLIDRDHQAKVLERKPDDLYGGTYRLVDKVLTRFGVSYVMVDQRDLSALDAAVRDDTNIIWVETPTNPVPTTRIVLGIERWKKATGCTLIEAYGLTETAPAACINKSAVTQCASARTAPSMMCASGSRC